MTEGEDLDGCDEPDLINNQTELINKNIETVTEEAGPMIHERNFNKILVMENLVEVSNETPVKTEIQKSPVTLHDFEKSHPTNVDMANNKNSSLNEYSGNANEEINVDNITLSQWSRGDVRLDGDLIKVSYL